MGAVVYGMTMSVDGFVADRIGDSSMLYPDLDELRNTPDLADIISRTGAVVMGRNSYDMSDGDFTDYEFQTPIFVVTHSAPEHVVRGTNDRLSVTFVTDGVLRALEQAKAAAGEKDTVVIGADVGKQLLAGGVVDEVHVDVFPILLGGGLRMFDELPAPIQLEKIAVSESATRTPIRFRIVT